MAKTSSRPSGERSSTFLPRRKAGVSLRRAGVRRSVVSGTPDWRKLLNEPAVVYGGSIAVLLAVVAAFLVTSTRSQQWLVPGVIASETRIVRQDFSILNREATDALRDRERERTPLHFRQDSSRLEEIREAIIDLPFHLAKYESFDELEEETKRAYGLNEERFIAVRDWERRFGAGAGVGEAELDPATSDWNRRVELLVREVIPDRPMVSEAAHSQVIERGIAIIRADGDIEHIDGRRIVIANGRVEETRRLAREVGWSGPALDVVAYRLAVPPRPTFQIDEAATHQAREAAAAAVGEIYDTHRRGEIIYRRGEIVSETALDLARQEESAYLAAAPRPALFGARTGPIGVSVLLVMALAVYLYHFYPRVVRNPLRVLALAASIALLLLLASALSLADPHSIYLTALAPILLLGMMLSIVYDQRLAMAATAVFALLVTLAINGTVGFYILALAGAGMAVSQLPEIRQRNTLMRAGILAAAMLGVGTFIVQFMEQPLSAPGIFRRIAIDAALASLSGVLVSLFILGVLPTIERLFDVTTGLKLVELRDSKQPLLRELQQRAPGTFNHSLTIASIAEDAAEAIGANALLTYVGGLYHDIGKMNKPAYFVENQESGYNKHSKLRPAMSLLVIVGHVKDGIEMGREFGLPRQIIHFIESHHGTTLVEYFYHAAKEQAAENPEQDAPSELEYRYPGPKPKTREAAILMLCDCVESATRAVADPTPSRIESLVHELARKRLLDGQFEDSALTLRELKLIEDSIIKSMCAIYHGRISYPDAKEGKSREQGSEQSDKSAGKAATA